MPEGPEIKIMSDYINYHSKDKIFTKLYHVEKGNVPIDSNLIENFKLKADYNGKELLLRLYHDNASLNISVFMGMSGNWLLTPTINWHDRKFTRMRLDIDNGNSLLLYGLYMGPKYRLNGFTGVKRGSDPTKDFDRFKDNILKDITKKVFNKPIAEVILNQKYFNGVGAYLTAEILGRLNINPHQHFNTLNQEEITSLLNMIKDCCEQAYTFGGGELLDWNNPFGKSRIDEWILFYNNKDICYKQKFGTRNIWILKKWNSKN